MLRTIRGKGDGRGKSGLAVNRGAVNRGAVNRGFTVIIIGYQYDIFRLM